MSFLDFFKSSNDRYLDTIFDTAEKGVTQMEFEYKEATLFGRYEIFLFNVVVAWTYFLNNGQLKTNQNLVGKKVSRLQSSMSKYGIDFDNQLMMEHYKMRYKMVKSEMASIEKSHIDSKRHYSVYFYQAMYNDPLSPTPLKNAPNFQESEKLKFTNALIDLHNWVLTRIKQSQ